LLSPLWILSFARRTWGKDLVLDGSSPTCTTDGRFSKLVTKKKAWIRRSKADVRNVVRWDTLVPFPHGVGWLHNYRKDTLLVTFLSRSNFLDSLNNPPSSLRNAHLITIDMIRIDTPTGSTRNSSDKPPYTGLGSDNIQCPQITIDRTRINTTPPVTINTSLATPAPSTVLKYRPNNYQPDIYQTPTGSHPSAVIEGRSNQPSPGHHQCHH
jgi:hypothetical protein